MNEQKAKRMKKKPKQLRESEKAHDAKIYSEGFQHGYLMGLEEGKKLASK